MVKVVVLSRLCYRKGTDVMVDLMPKVRAVLVFVGGRRSTVAPDSSSRFARPQVLNKYPTVHFIVAGDGPKQINVVECVEKHGLEERVTMLGRVERENVFEVLRGGNVFLNCSLTESFCISVLEAASMGCVVVSADVGGVREVFEGMKIQRDGGVVYSDVGDLEEGLSAGIERWLRTTDEEREEWAEEVRSVYTWDNVAAGVSEVYSQVVSTNAQDKSFFEICEEWCEGRRFVASVCSVIFGASVTLVMMLTDRLVGKWERAHDRDHLYNKAKVKQKRN